ncbi:c-type cytochrome [Hydrogenimonas urashimensis]|uniref:c-type cytochrome n=1 Tax=Hydrogenimonas urashimensis TaxID=2740515 RepID=UPI001915056C|nr:cytochrome c [Hydrogenimonas urashimensis]
MRNIIRLSILSVATLLLADPKAGEKVYQANCSQCHSIHMTGGMGRDFNLVSYTRTKKEIIAYAGDPGSMYRQFGYSANAMPTLPLTPKEIEDVADFIDALQPFKKWMATRKD